MKTPRIFFSPMGIFLIAVIILVLLVVLYRTSRNEGFTDGAVDGVFTMIYADWCPHCKAVKPDFSKAVDASPITINGKKVKFEMFEEKANESDIAKFPKVEGYPTFFFKSSKNAGGPEEYRGARTVEAMKTFIESKTS